MVWIIIIFLFLHLILPRSDFRGELQLLNWKKSPWVWKNVFFRKTDREEIVKFLWKKNAKLIFIQHKPSKFRYCWFRKWDLKQKKWSIQKHPVSVYILRKKNYKKKKIIKTAIHTQKPIKKNKQKLKITITKKKTIKSQPIPNLQPTSYDKPLYISVIHIHVLYTTFNYTYTGADYVNWSSIW